MYCCTRDFALTLVNLAYTAVHLGLLNPDRLFFNRGHLVLCIKISHASAYRTDADVIHADAMSASEQQNKFLFATLFTAMKNNCLLGNKKFKC